MLVDSNRYIAQNSDMSKVIKNTDINVFATARKEIGTAKLQGHNTC